MNNSHHGKVYLVMMKDKKINMTDTKFIVTFDFVIDDDDKNWIEATDQERETAIADAIKYFKNQLEMVEVSQGIFTAVAVESKVI